jgi:type VI secretion system (T6SS) effector TldE1-like protein
MSSGRRQLSVETIVVSTIGAAFFGLGALICVAAYKGGQPNPDQVAAIMRPSPLLPPALPSTEAPSAAPGPLFAPAPEPTSIFTAPLTVETPTPAPRPKAAPVRAPAPAPAEKPTSPSIVLGPSAPLPPSRPIELNAPAPAPSANSPAPAASPKPTPTNVFADLGPKPTALSAYDHFTAVYDLTAHTVYLPDGERLEAHSGLGSLKDDPAHVEEKDRGATPPHIYDLTLREDLFHGVQALRLNPVGGPSAIFGRAGLLAHTYMLGPTGDSNGCVSFKNYDAFLQAFQSGRVKKLAVVGNLN